MVRVMLCFILDQIVRNLGGTLSETLYFLLACVSFAGLFIIIFGLFQGLVLGKWHYSAFLIGIIVIGLVGIEPAWVLLTQGFPNFSF